MMPHGKFRNSLRPVIKIALISPKGPLYRHRGGIWKKSLRYQPLTLTTLAALVPEDVPAKLTLIDEGIADVPLDLEADIIGLTVITGTARRAYELADHFRARGIVVVLGGPHVTLIPEDAAPHADAIVVGYAEDSWPQLLRDFAAGKMAREYRQAPGLEIGGRPFPRRELLPSRHFLTSNVFEATRGCVHSCDFCVVPTAWGRKPFQKPVAEVVADIRPEVEPLGHIDVAAQGGDHYDADVLPRGVFTHPLADLEAVHHRQHDVEQNQIRMVPRNGFHGLLSAEGHEGLVAVLLHQELQRHDDARLVVHDENLFRHGGSPRLVATRPGGPCTVSGL